MSTPQKEVIYVDIDDEITGLIDKVNSSKSKIVALVLPKRAAVLQSIVNMKLLKRTADESGRRVVLITSEAAIIPLAGATGMYVAKTLQSKPAIPEAPLIPDMNETVDANLSEVPAEVDTSRTVGELAGTTTEDEAIEIDNDEPSGEEAAVAASAPKINKKLRIPNFEKFRMLILLGGTLLVLLLVGLVYALNVMPKARITIKTDTSSINSDTDLVASTTQKELDKENLVIPASVKELKKTDNEKVATTGQKDNGTRAFGQVTLSMPCSSNVPVVEAYTFVSTGNLNFVTQSEADLKPSIGPGGTCRFTDTVNVVAQNAGDQYNISGGRTFTVAGYSSISGTNEDPMTGGTTKIVKVVSQSDIDSAKQKLVDRTGTTASDELKKQLLDDGLVGINETLSGSDPVIKSTPNVGEEAGEVVVTAEVKYTVTAVKRDDLKQVITSDAGTKIDKSKQVILEDGLDEAVIKLTEKKPNGQLRINLHAVVVAGPQLDADTIKQDIAGKKRGETQRIIQSRPGIKDVTIDYSPFFVNGTPKKLNKITIVFENSDATQRQ